VARAEIAVPFPAGGGESGMETEGENVSESEGAGTPLNDGERFLQFEKISSRQQKGIG